LRYVLLWPFDSWTCEIALLCNPSGRTTLVYEPTPEVITMNGLLFIDSAPYDLLCITWTVPRKVLETDCIEQSSRRESLATQKRNNA
jgi:hypothetical protein